MFMLSKTDEMFILLKVWLRQQGFNFYGPPLPADFPSYPDYDAISLDYSKNDIHFNFAITKLKHTALTLKQQYKIMYQFKIQIDYRSIIDERCTLDYTVQNESALKNIILKFKNAIDNNQPDYIKMYAERIKIEKLLNNMEN